MNSATRVIHVKDLPIGGPHPVSVQSMCATRTRDIEATLDQIRSLEKAGADIIRIAVDNDSDVEALKTLRAESSARLSVDLQENYLLAAKVAPWVDKIRYNPGHLHHLEKDRATAEKVEGLVRVAREHNLAIRIGVNCGSIAPELLERYGSDRVKAITESALTHCGIMDDLKFENYLVSIKDSDPYRVITVNEAFHARRPDVPLHLGVTEAGMPPDGILKTRIAFEKLLSHGIGNTLRVSLTVPFDQKFREVEAGKAILADVAAGRFTEVPAGFGKGLNVISCPSCSRVQNEAFVELAGKVREMAAFAKDLPVTIAVMGCRVNGPGETDDADLGLWCGPSKVTLKKKTRTLGAYGYDQILPLLKQELEKLSASR
ncbi:MAG: (E)-4-hydroxy-3-methylbut-2-enyl-diphosphate synthase [Candidatus Omnitrophica bacterium]|nr:(E)-4-hydroxy-3-methylbut-2-enyl-diphosphate synthase [Candidatus Omnitrophota bacterium]